VNKVLIVVNLGDASPRIPGLAKYLAEFGWESFILTPPMEEKFSSPPSGFKVVETIGYKRTDVRYYARDHFESRKPYRKIKPFLKFFYRRFSEIRHYPDRQKDWVPFALKSARDLLASQTIDALLTSSPPAIAHIVARQLKEEHRIPWVADFRDLWTQNHNYPYSRFRKFFEKKLELKTLSTADALVAVSKPMADKLTMLHGEKQVFTITNGFDPEKMGATEVDLTLKFTITYTGQIYKKQNTEKLLVALRDLISEGTLDRNDVEVRIFGPANEELKKQAERFGLAGVVVQYGTVSREVCFQRQKESQLLWQITWEDPVEKGAYSGKIFEYLGAHRNILATGGFGGDVVEELIKETNSGFYCSNVEDVKTALRKLYSEYKAKGFVLYHGDLEKIDKYSYREMAKRFADILEDLKCS